MQKTMKKLVFLLALVCTVICCIVFAACGDKGNGNGGGNNNDDKITYSVTVTSTDTVEYTSITAYWKRDTEVKGSATLSANGTASVLLAKATYTVDFGTVEGYTYTAQTAKATAPNVNITLTPDSSNTHTLMLTVSSELPLPADAAVDIYDAEDTLVLEGVSIIDGLNNIAGIPNDTDVTLVFASDVDYLEGEVNVTSSETTSTLNITAKEIVYTVTVDAEAGLDLDGVTVVFTAVGKDDVTGEIEDGVATITISALAGEYTVELVDLNPAYKYEPAQVSYKSGERTATLNVTAIVYVVTLNKLSDAVDESEITVELHDAEGEKVAEASVVEGVANVYAPEGEYTIVLTSSGSVDYGFISDGFNAERQATVHVAPKPAGGAQYVEWQDSIDAESNVTSSGEPYTITAIGAYYIEVQTYYNNSWYSYHVRNHVFKFTAPAGDTKLYTFSWAYLDGNDTINQYSDYGAEALAETEESVLFLINGGDSVNFALQYNNIPIHDDDGNELNPVTEDSYHFILMVEEAEAPTEGDMYMPIEVGTDDLTGAHTGPEGKTDVYFRLSLNGSSEQLFTITVDEGTEIYYSGTKITELTKITSGDCITVSRHVNGYLRVVSSSAPVKFTLEKYVTPGSHPEAAIKILKGEEVSYTFTADDNAWFAFTPEEDGDYRIFGIQDFTGAETGTGYNDQGWYVGLEGEVEPIDGAKLPLTANTKYYIQLYCSLGNTVIFKIDDYAPILGKLSEPIELEIPM